MDIITKVMGDTDAAAKLRRKAERAPREFKNAAKRAATVMGRAVKGNLRRRRTGLLAKSIGSKVHEGRRGKLTMLAGPRRGFRTKIVKQEKKKLTGLRTVKGKEKKIVLKAARGVKEGQTIDPVRYAHLAGPKRKQDYMEPAFQQSKGQVLDIFKEAARTIARA